MRIITCAAASHSPYIPFAYATNIGDLHGIYPARIQNVALGPKPGELRQLTAPAIAFGLLNGRVTSEKSPQNKLQNCLIM